MNGKVLFLLSKFIKWPELNLLVVRYWPALCTVYVPPFIGQSSVSCHVACALFQIEVFKSGLL